MSSDSVEARPPQESPADAWERAASELRACKEAQRRAWGNIDSSDLGRYLAGEAVGDELTRIEDALDNLPDLRTLTDLVRDVLDELEPMDAAAQEPVSPVLSLAAARQTRRRVSGWLRRYSAVAAAACVLLTLGMTVPAPFSPRDRSDPVRTSVLDRGLAMRFDLPAGGLSLLALPAGPHPGLPQNVIPEPPGERPNPPGVGAVARSMIASPDSGPVTQGWLSVQQVNRLHRQGVYFQRRGELTRAEPTLCQVHAYCRDHLGPKHPATQSTALHLAGVYQFALNNAASYTPTTAPLPVPTAPQPTPTASTRSTQTLHSTARQLAECINSRPGQEVQNSVVPILVEGFKAAPGVEDRRACIRALARLGPSAGPAVEALVDRLGVADAGEFRDVLLTLEQIGPAAESAIPALARLVSARPVGVVKFPVDDPISNAKMADRQRSLNVEEQQLARETLARLRGKEGRVGVRDEVGCFSVRTLSESCKKIRQLVKQTGVEVLVETRCAGADKKPASPHHPELGKRAIHVLLDPTGPAVEVRLSDDLRRKGLSVDQLRQQLLACCRQHKFDRALVEGVQTITRLVGKK